jgi:hypothetical protein
MRPIWREILIVAFGTFVPEIAFAQKFEDKSAKNGAVEAISNAERVDREIFFESKIRPLLIDRCLKCHGGEKTSSGLKVYSRAVLEEGGDSGPSIVPGDAGASLLIQAVGRKSEDVSAMPPKEALTADQVRDLTRWITDGAHWPADAPKLTTDSKPKENPAADHWAFRPITDPPIPSVRSDWSRSSIDEFVAAVWNGLKPAPDSDAPTLIRRLAIDLTGLPPEPALVRKYMNRQGGLDRAELEKIVDDLLASPRFGERWARHWMDVVRYADTAGDNADYPIPEAARYRDYLIDSFNSDKPFDDLVKEQLAGDILARELVSSKPDSNEDDRRRYAEMITATTYLGLSRRYATAPFEMMHLTIEDAITTTGLAFLGLNMRCARCHDHKFDPVTARDYYAIYGIFDSTKFPFAGSEEFQSKKIYRQNFVPLLPDHEARKRVDDTERLMADSKSRTTDFVGPLTPEMVKSQKNVRRSIERYTRFGNLPEDLPTAYGVTEGDPHDVPLQRKGEPDQPGPVIQRGYIAIIAGHEPPVIPPGSSGRKQLAEWLVSPENPLTARVYVNRVWYQLFGKGLVETPNDFGTRGSAPSHPELLDHLASEFKKDGWSTKRLIRRILMSRVYGLASGDFEGQSGVDPDNRRLWRHNRRRLDAESLRDGLLALSGNLDLNRPGPHPFPPIEKWKWTQHNPFRERYDSNHRTIFLMTQRIQKHPFLALFDGPDTNASTGRRSVSGVPLQSLHLANHPFVKDQVAAFADRAFDSTGLSEGHDSYIDALWMMAIGRKPDDFEKRLAIDLLTTATVSPSATKVEGKSGRAALAHALLMSNAFLYVD